MIKKILSKLRYVAWVIFILLVISAAIWVNSESNLGFWDYIITPEPEYCN